MGDYFGLHTMRYSRVHRLLRIILLVQGSDRHSAKSLAAECGVIEAARNCVALMPSAAFPRSQERGPV